MELSSSQKGGLAELKVAAEAADLGFGILRPATEGLRYDLVLDVGGTLLRVQVKWATLKGLVVSIPLRTSRHTPGGYVRTQYSTAEIDGLPPIAASSTAASSCPSRSSSDTPTCTCDWARRETVSCAVLRWLTITRLGL